MLSYIFRYMLLGGHCESKNIPDVYSCISFRQNFKVTKERITCVGTILVSFTLLGLSLYITLSGSVQDQKKIEYPNGFANFTTSGTIEIFGAPVTAWKSNGKVYLSFEEKEFTVTEPSVFCTSPDTLPKIFRPKMSKESKYQGYIEWVITIVSGGKETLGDFIINENGAICFQHCSVISQSPEFQMGFGKWFKFVVVYPWKD